ncbi:uncharacterized protein J3R85_020433 [Psidium guajava]|nr:uncharacterized protein J3R85_020433 [Psidium guajava]
MLLEKESPDVVGTGVAERGGLGLLEKGDTDLELTPDGVRTGFGAERRSSVAVDKQHLLAAKMGELVRNEPRKRCQPFSLFSSFTVQLLNQVHIRRHTCL